MARRGEKDTAPPKWVKENEEKIYKLASLHCSPEEIEWIIGKPYAEIERWCSKGIQQGRAQLMASIRRDQITSSRNGNANMQKWLGQVMLGQRETDDTGVVNLHMDGWERSESRDWVKSDSESVGGSLDG